MAYQLQFEQRIPISINDAWTFISQPENLSLITPPAMDFKIMNGDKAGSMHAGQIIIYRVKPMLNIAITWVTEITHMEQEKYFVDEQRSGPYSMWHHEHLLREINGGTHMIDTITYIPPLGILGRLANTIFIEKQLYAIFKFRYSAIEKIFGKWQEAAPKTSLLTP